VGKRVIIAPLKALKLACRTIRWLRRPDATLLGSGGNVFSPIVGYWSARERTGDGFGLLAPFSMISCAVSLQYSGSHESMHVRRMIPLLPFCFVLTILFSAVSFGEEEGNPGLKLMDCVLLTLAKQPEIHLQQQEVEIARGILKTESGAFDTNLGASIAQDHSNIPNDTETEISVGSSSTVTDTTDYALTATKLFRNGVSIGPNLETVYTDTSPSDFEPVSTSSVDFLINVPLMRGLGRKATGAREMAAETDYRASELLLRHTAAQSVLNTVTAYWNYLSAQRHLFQLRASESRARELLKQYETLVAADEKPAGDLQQIQANLASRSAARVAGEQSLYQAQQELGLAMGVSYDLFKSLRPPIDPFPQPSETALKQSKAILPQLLTQSLANRADYLALQKNQESAKILVEAARNGLKPQLDFNLNFGYSGLDEGRALQRYVTPFVRNVPGLSAAAGLTYHFPVQNNAAQGDFIQQKAVLRQMLINSYDLGRTIFSGVSLAFTAVENSEVELRMSKMAVESYRVALRHEKEKYRLGVSTLLDIINMDDRLTNALFNEIDAHARLAIALANLRFQSGTMLTIRQGGYAVVREDITTLPIPAEVTR
jgi:outer membrane protein